MSTTVGIVDWMGHSATTAAARRFSGLTLIEWIARRVTEVQQISRVVVLLTPDQQSLQSLLPSDIEPVITQAPDSLSALAELCRAPEVEAIVRVGADSPLFDPQLVEQLIQAAELPPECDYAGYCSADGSPVVESRLGLAAEWCRASAVLEASRQLGDGEREPPLRGIWTHPESFRVRLLPLPQALDGGEIRLAVENEEDWEHVHVIYEALAPDEINWRRIARLLSQQPAIRRRMAALNQRGAD